MLLKALLSSQSTPAVFKQSLNCTLMDALMKESYIHLVVFFVSTLLR